MARYAFETAYWLTVGFYTLNIAEMALMSDSFYKVIYGCVFILGWGVLMMLHYALTLWPKDE